MEDISFLELIKSVPSQEIEDFFKKHFLDPLMVSLDGDEKIPAEEIRQARKQTIKIKNIILTLRQK